MSSAMKLLEPAIKAVTTVKFFESYVDKSGRLTWDNYKDQLEKASLFPRQRFPRALENDSQAFGNRFAMPLGSVSQWLRKSFPKGFGESLRIAILAGKWAIPKGFGKRLPRALRIDSPKVLGNDSEGLRESIPKDFGKRFPRALGIVSQRV